MNPATTQSHPSAPSDSSPGGPEPPVAACAAFISIAKLLGSIAILIPGLVRVKEWAYAGLFFDLAGAIYSGIAVGGKFDPMMLFMLVWIVPGVLSYYYWRRRLTWSGDPDRIAATTPALGQ